MTRVNVLPVKFLLDQHLMAEYRELPMVLSALNRSKKSKNWISTKIPIKYTFGEGHVKFFYNKKEYLELRYKKLIKELKYRGFGINPKARTVNFTVFSTIKCVEWSPNSRDMKLNFNRIMERVNINPDWYRYKGIVMTAKDYHNRVTKYLNF